MLEGAEDAKLTTSRLSREEALVEDLLYEYLAYVIVTIWISPESTWVIMPHPHHDLLA